LSGFRLDIGFIDHLLVVPANNYNTIADFQHFSSYYTLNLLQPAMPSLDVSWQRLLRVEILQLPALNSSFTDRTDLAVPIIFLMTPRYRPRGNTPFPTVPISLRVDSLLRESVYRAVA
jgi:hypothetical protein